MSTMMAGVKDQKVNKIKSIKKLSNEKINLTKKVQDLRDSNVALKMSFDENTKFYLSLQIKYDIPRPDCSVVEVETEKEGIEIKMTSLLGSIETDRASYMKQRDLIKVRHTVYTARYVRVSHTVEGIIYHLSADNDNKIDDLN